MARILMSWEIGHHHGHVSPLLPIAKKLRAAGHEVVFALKEIRFVGKMICDEGFRLLQAPAHPDFALPAGAPQPESMSGILRLLGFGDASVLGVYLNAWRELITLARADLVVASYAPVSLLAARTLGVASAWVGMAFELPPETTPSPSFRPWLNTSNDALLANDEHVVAACNEALRPHGISLSAVHEIFQAQRHLLWTFPELDSHFAQRAAQQARGSLIYCGGVFVDSLGPQPQWPASADASRPKVLGYLRLDKPRLAQWTAALAEVDANFHLVVPGIDAASASSMSRANVSLSGSHIHLSNALRECSAVLTYGGHGTVCASLLSGRPLVLVPEQMEGVAIAKQVAKLGAGRGVQPADAANVATACREVIGNPRYRQAAEAFRSRYAGYSTETQAARIARVVHELLLTRHQ